MLSLSSLGSAYDDCLAANCNQISDNAQFETCRQGCQMPIPAGGAAPSSMTSVLDPIVNVYAAIPWPIVIATGILGLLIAIRHRKRPDAASAAS